MIMWQYTNDPNDINTAILEKDSNWAVSYTHLTLPTILLV